MIIPKRFLQLTGRVEEKRRWSEGIHQAVEAKEGLKIQVHLDVRQYTSEFCFIFYFEIHLYLSDLKLYFSYSF